MMKTCFKSGALCALLMLSALAGCAQQSRQMHAMRASHDALALPPSSMLENSAAMQHDFAWEFGRNDGNINYRPYGAVRPYGWTETYTRDRFYSHGGHQHDSSRFEIRSYRVR